jgi:hypothetical protein
VLEKHVARSNGDVVVHAEYPIWMSCPLELSTAWFPLKEQKKKMTVLRIAVPAER